MDEGAGFNIAVGIDMQIPAAACNASLHILAVILEVDSKKSAWFFRYSRMQCTITSRCSGEGSSSGTASFPTRHIVEEPRKLGALGNQVVDVLFQTEGVNILAGIAAGSAKDQLFSPAGCPWRA